MATNTSYPSSRPPRPIPVPHLPPALVAGATVLAVWAHPDDECYLGGGLMASVSASGGHVVNATATLGEHGTPDPVAMPPARLAAIRRRELESALSELGVHESVILGYEDGGLDAIDVDLGARRVAALIADVAPDLVLSFGPDGITGHPDHIAVGRWTERAVASSARPPALLQAAVGTDTPADLIDALRAVGAYFPGFPVPGEPGDELSLSLDESAVDTKLAALAAHVSQTEPLRALVGEATYRRLAAVEVYRPANPVARELLSGTRQVSVA